MITQKTEISGYVFVGGSHKHKRWQLISLVWHSHNIYMAGKDGEDFYVDIGDSESGKNVAREDMSSKDMLDTGNAMEALTRVDLDLAYSSEKSVNLDTLMMHVWAWEKEFEALATDDISVDCIEKALAYDFFSGILESEWRLNCTFWRVSKAITGECTGNEDAVNQVANDIPGVQSNLLEI
ncbi:uncharacterized protein LOC108222506 [Daucus carota subsp. sativus]|nr:PREDICTED: uncharacterized protein LOC108222695 [Daucus carota subsp. sativus]